jgi:hypothetical protein
MVGVPLLTTYSPTRLTVGLCSKRLVNDASSLPTSSSIISCTDGRLVPCATYAVVAVWGGLRGTKSHPRTQGLYMNFGAGYEGNRR